MMESPSIFAVNVGNDGTVRIIDLAYTAFMRAKNGKNKDDGGPCDWFTDTYPDMCAQIEKWSTDYYAELASRDSTIAALRKRVSELERQQNLVTEEMVEKGAKAVYDHLESLFPDGALPGGVQLFADPDDALDSNFKHEAGCDRLARAVLGAALDKGEKG